MRLKVALVALAAFLCLAGAAQGFQWHLRYGQAKHATKEFAEVTCRRDHKCKAYGVGKCRRQSESRVDCAVAFLYKGVAEPGDEVVCALILHWGVSHSGEVALKRHGRPHCQKVESEGESEAESEPGLR
jgi:hypothetical protein